MISSRLAVFVFVTVAAAAAAQNPSPIVPQTASIPQAVATQPPAALAASDKDAIKQRSSAFYDAIIANQKATAQAIVAPESQAFFAQQYELHDLMKASVVSVTYDAATGIATVKTMRVFMVPPTGPTETYINDAWKLVDGQWDLTIPDKLMVDTPYGKMPIKNTAKQGAVLFGGRVLPDGHFPVNGESAQPAPAGAAQAPVEIDPKVLQQMMSQMGAAPSSTSAPPAMTPPASSVATNPANAATGQQSTTQKPKKPKSKQKTQSVTPFSPPQN